MQNVPLGKMRSLDFSSLPLDRSQLAVYYASYRHLYKVAYRSAKNPRINGTPSAGAIGTGAILALGAWATLRVIATQCRKGGLDLEKAARYGLDRKVACAPYAVS
jgi:hypothetical protein